MRISEILNQTQYFFDCLASDSVKMNKIGHIVARDKFFEGLERLGVYIKPFQVLHFNILNNVTLSLGKDKIHKVDVILNIIIKCYSAPG